LFVHALLSLLALLALFACAHLSGDAGNRILVGSADVVCDELVPVSNRPDGGRVLVENVDLFERETLGLRDAEVGEDEASDASRSPDEEYLGPEVAVPRVDNVGGGITDTKVPKPVRGRRHRHGLCADGEREDLGGDDPCNGTPGSSKEGDIDTYKCDEDLLASLVFNRDRNTNDGNEVLAKQHAGGTNEEETTTSNVINGPESGDGHDDVHYIGHNGDDESVRESRVGKEGCTIVENEVDAKIIGQAA